VPPLPVARLAVLAACRKRELAQAGVVPAAAAENKVAARGEAALPAEPAGAVGPTHKAAGIDAADADAARPALPRFSVQCSLCERELHPRLRRLRHPRHQTRRHVSTSYVSKGDR